MTTVFTWKTFLMTVGSEILAETPIRKLMSSFCSYKHNNFWAQLHFTVTNLGAAQHICTPDAPLLC